MFGIGPSYLLALSAVLPQHRQHVLVPLSSPPTCAPSATARHRLPQVGAAVQQQLFTQLDAAPAAGPAERRALQKVVAHVRPRARISNIVANATRSSGPTSPCDAASAGSSRQSAGASSDSTAGPRVRQRGTEVIENHLETGEVIAAVPLLMSPGQQPMIFHISSAWKAV